MLSLASLLSIFSIILPFGFIGGLVGILLHKKFEDSPNEKIIVLGGMFSTTLILMIVLWLLIK